MLPDAAVMWIPCDLLRTTCLPHAEILRRTPTHTRTRERVGPAPAPTHATQDASHHWDIVQPWDAQQWHTHGRPALGSTLFARKDGCAPEAMATPTRALDVMVFATNCPRLLS